MPTLWCALPCTLEIWIFHRKLVGCIFCYFLLMVHSFFIFCTNHRKIRKLYERLNTSSSIRTSDILNHSEVDRKWSGTVATSIQYVVSFRILSQAGTIFENTLFWWCHLRPLKFRFCYKLFSVFIQQTNWWAKTIKKYFQEYKNPILLLFFYICIKLNVARLNCSRLS